MTFELERARDARRPFTVVEVDLDDCALSYSLGLCTAALGVTGAVKCYNTRTTCQDPDNFSKTVKTYRFCTNTPSKPVDLDALPFIESTAITPTRLKIGAGLGDRGSVTVVLSDGKHNDVGIDPYVTERSYDPLTQGTYFGRLHARNSYYLGRPLRVMTGYLVRNAAGAWAYEAENFETRLYFLENITPPDGAGRVTIVAKDILKLADDERAQAPRPAQGRLETAITAADAVPIVRNLLPAGVGAEYGTSGKLRINAEVFTFTRAGDALTLTARAQSTTTAADHAVDDAVQEGLVFTAQRAHEMLYTLLTTFAGLSSDYLPLTDWAAEDELYNNRLYNAEIYEPTGVNQLVGEICEQGPAYVWWDEVAAEVIYRALRPASSAAIELDDDAHFLADSINVKERLDQRISECWVYFGPRNPTEPVDKASNYAALVIVAGDGSTAHKYGQDRVKKIYARFLTSSARTFASEIGSSVVQRYNEAPRELAFALTPKDGDLHQGGLFRAVTRRLQGPDGAAATAVYQVLQVAKDYARDQLRYSALQERYTPSADAGARILTISADELDYNLRTRHDELYAAPTEAVTVRLVIEAGVVVGSTSTATPALDTGTWPAGSTLTIDWRGRVQGRGGEGGAGGAVGTGEDGEDGGPAFKARIEVAVTFGAEAEVWGGGGGGGGGGHALAGTSRGGGGGGGGAGTEPGPGGPGPFEADDGAAGTDESGGEGGRGIGGALGNGDGGRGGTPGQPGTAGDAGDSPGGAAGAAGTAIDGVSFLTITGTADVRGSQLN